MSKTISRARILEKWVIPQAEFIFQKLIIDIHRLREEKQMPQSKLYSPRFRFQSNFYFQFFIFHHLLGALCSVLSILYGSRERERERERERVERIEKVQRERQKEKDREKEVCVNVCVYLCVCAR